jgi:integrase
MLGAVDVIGDIAGHVTRHVAGDVTSYITGCVIGYVTRAILIYLLTSDKGRLSEVRGEYVAMDVTIYVSGDVVVDQGEARGYADQAMSPATRRAYQADWHSFTTWCSSVGAASLPASPATVGGYMADQAKRGFAVATITRHLAAVATAHRLAGHQLDTRHPAIREVLKGIRRVHGSRQRQAAPATTGVVRAMIAAIQADSIIGVRDRALLLIGFAGAFRRSELVALTLGDIAAEPEGLRIRIARSKTDQAGEGHEIGIARTDSALCPVAALENWITASGITGGPLFRAVDRHGNVRQSLSDKAVSLIVKARAEAAGLDPALFSGHSLRAGLATSAAAAGLAEGDIQRQTRHRSVTQLRRYVRHASVFVGNVSKGVGL